MYVIWGIHTLAFLAKLRIYKIEEPKQKNDKDDEYFNAEKTPGSDKNDGNKVTDGTILPSH